MQTGRHTDTVRAFPIESPLFARGSLLVFFMMSDLRRGHGCASARVLSRMMRCPLPSRRGARAVCVRVCSAAWIRQNW